MLKLNFTVFVSEFVELKVYVVGLIFYVLIHICIFISAK